MKIRLLVVATLVSILTSCADIKSQKVCKSDMGEYWNIPRVNCGTVKVIDCKYIVFIPDGGHSYSVNLPAQSHFPFDKYSKLIGKETPSDLNIALSFGIKMMDSCN